LEQLVKQILSEKTGKTAEDAPNKIYPVDLLLGTEKEPWEVKNTKTTYSPKYLFKKFNGCYTSYLHSAKCRCGY
jgi:hypothetical protein